MFQIFRLMPTLLAAAFIDAIVTMPAMPPIRLSFHAAAAAFAASQRYAIPADYSPLPLRLLQVATPLDYYDKPRH